VRDATTSHGASCSRGAVQLHLSETGSIIMHKPIASYEDNFSRDVTYGVISWGGQLVQMSHGRHLSDMGQLGAHTAGGTTTSHGVLL